MWQHFGSASFTIWQVNCVRVLDDNISYIICDDQWMRRRLPPTPGSIYSVTPNTAESKVIPTIRRAICEMIIQWNLSSYIVIAAWLDICWKRIPWHTLSSINHGKTTPFIQKTCPDRERERDPPITLILIIELWARFERLCLAFNSWPWSMHEMKGTPSLPYFVDHVSRAFTRSFVFNHNHLQW